MCRETQRRSVPQRNIEKYVQRDKGVSSQKHKEDCMQRDIDKECVLRDIETECLQRDIENECVLREIETEFLQRDIEKECA